MTDYVLQNNNESRDSLNVWKTICEIVLLHGWYNTNRRTWVFSDFNKNQDNTYRKKERKKERKIRTKNRTVNQLPQRYTVELFVGNRKQKTTDDL